MLPAALQSLLVIGHNPGMHNLALKVTERGPKRYLDLLEEKFPTCALAVLECDIDSWKQLVPGISFLTHFVTPKTLDD